MLLLFISAISVVTPVPSATQSNTTVANLNDVSESCLALILLVQTALVGIKHAPKSKTAKPSGAESNVAKPCSSSPTCCSSLTAAS